MWYSFTVRTVFYFVSARFLSLALSYVLLFRLFLVCCNFNFVLMPPFFSVPDGFFVFCVVPRLPALPCVPCFCFQVFPDMIFLILVLSQWFLAVWSVVGAVLYFRLFQGNRTCAREHIRYYLSSACCGWANVIRIRTHDGPKSHASPSVHAPYLGL